jgi:hypothetical protein
MLRPKRKKNGIAGAGRIYSVLAMGWLIIGWSRPAFPDEGRHLKLAPIRISSYVNGYIGYTYLSNNFGTYKSTSQTLGAQVNYNLGAESFFWQPWFALVSANLGVDINGNKTRASPNSFTSGGTLLNGDAALDMLKYSRFPFRAHVYDSKQHATGDTVGINSDFRSSGYDLNQAYKTRNGSIDSSASYIYNKNGRINFGTEEIRKQLQFDVTASPITRQTLRVTGAFKDIDHPLKGDTLKADSVVANHVYQPNSSFGIASLLNLLKNSYTLSPANSTSQQDDYNSQQFSSYASWRPIGNPLTVTSSLRLFKSVSSVNNNLPIGFNDTNFNLGANYAWSTLLRAYGSVNVNDSNNTQTVSTAAALAAQKVFGELDTVNLGGFIYTRDAGVSLGTATVTTSSPNLGGPNKTSTTSAQNLGLNLGHQLSKNSNLSNGLLRTNLYQRYSEVLSTRHSPTSRLESGVSLSWSLSESRETTRMSFRLKDSRYLTGIQSFSQLVNLQATRAVRLLHHQSLSGNLTIQSSRSSFRGITSPFYTTPNAALSYGNQRLFAVRNLSFTSTLNISAMSIASSQNLSQNINGTARATWDNRLDYFIGRVRVKLYSTISEVNNGLHSSLFFNVNRSF